MIKLSKREREVLPYIAVLCLSNREIAHQMGLSVRTVEDHRAHIIKKMQVRNAMELARKVALGERHGTSNALPVWETLGALLSQENSAALP